MKKFKGKYRIESNRLKAWDYSSDALYFITLVTQNRDCNLGNIVNSEMILSDFGKIIETEWLKSFDIRNELFLDEYIIMPDHVHGIIIIGENAYNEPSAGEGPQYEKLPVIIGSYKSAVSKLIHRSGRKDFRWQKSYHDRIIRDQHELESIREYIRLNPERWLAAR